MTRSRVSILLSVILAGALAAPTAAHAQRKNKPKPAEAACGLDFLPFTQGAEWTYDFTVPDEPPEPPQGQLQVDTPQKLTIKVISVDKIRGDSYEIRLEETHRKVTNATVLTCDKETLQVSPGSFFAAGELGGGLGMAIENFKWGDSASYAHKKGKLKAKDSWREDISFHVTRAPNEGTAAEHHKARVEVERSVKIAGRDGVNSALRDHPKATKVVVTLTGRAIVDDKSVDMPAAKATLWFDANVGLVKAENRFGQGWVLSAFSWPEAQ